MAEANDYCNSLFISTVKNEPCLSGWRRLMCARWLFAAPLWMNVSHQTKHDTKLPTYYKRWLKYFIYSADYLWRVYATMLFQLQNVTQTGKATNWAKKNIGTGTRERRRTLNSVQTSRAAHRAQRIHRHREKKSAQRQKNRSAYAMHVCVFHLRLMMCHIYEVSDSGSLNDRQLSRAMSRRYSLAAHENRPSSNGRSMCIYKFRTHVTPVSNFRPTKSEKRARRRRKSSAKSTNAHGIRILAHPYTHAHLKMPYIICWCLWMNCCSDLPHSAPDSLGSCLSRHTDSILWPKRKRTRNGHTQKSGKKSLNLTKRSDDWSFRHIEHW